MAFSCLPLATTIYYLTSQKNQKALSVRSLNRPISKVAEFAQSLNQICTYLDLI